ncbi:hypothetical protein QWZ14_16730 [Paeniroseomonas aquatica]|uniref:Uncharacterized protein n=1 Tax=Paeniroseomonas aquatica TaxID=373043 RepID=A0ABT8A8H5_9PROT|nr:hypothetical protein [Paeniroseomonas aquatica]MDN3566016.1 hypothetical protein [Paeniroseomonas aquatica]
MTATVTELFAREAFSPTLRRALDEFAAAQAGAYRNNPDYTAHVEAADRLLSVFARSEGPLDQCDLDLVRSAVFISSISRLTFGLATTERTAP